MRKVIVECNNLACKHQWEMSVDDYRITGNRVSMPLPVCPKCGRMDAPYLVDIITET